MFESTNECKLKDQARALRIASLRAIARAARGSPGTTFSACELVTTLLFDGMVLDDSMSAKDRLVVSNPSLRPLVAVALALLKLVPPNYPEPGHDDWPHVPCTTLAPLPSLGQGISVANGIALGLAATNPSTHIFVLLGDGELQTGLVWEAAATTAHLRLHRVTALVDANGGQAGGAVSVVKAVEPLVAKWRSFGWNALEVNGHGMNDISHALSVARRTTTAPSVIIARTKRGQGLSDFVGLPDSAWPSLDEGRLEVLCRALSNDGELP